MSQQESTRGPLEIDVKERNQNDKDGARVTPTPARRQISRISGGWQESDPLMNDHW